jgi:hypothetical protein
MLQQRIKYKQNQKEETPEMQRLRNTLKHPQPVETLVTLQQT